MQFQKDKFKEVFEGARRAGKPVLVIIDTLEDDHFAKNTLANDDIMEIAVGEAQTESELFCLCWPPKS